MRGLGRDGGIRGKVERNEGGKNKYNQMQNGPSSSAPRKTICLLDKQVLSHTINSKHQKGEERKNYFPKPLNVSGKVIKFNCLESGCSFCKLPPIEAAHLNVK